jgi:hypothetical protein
MTRETPENVVARGTAGFSPGAGVRQGPYPDTSRKVRSGVAEKHCCAVGEGCALPGELETPPDGETAPRGSTSRDGERAHLEDARRSSTVAEHEALVDGTASGYPKRGIRGPVLRRSRPSRSVGGSPRCSAPAGALGRGGRTFSRTMVMTLAFFLSNGIPPASYRRRGHCPCTSRRDPAVRGLRSPVSRALSRDKKEVT